VKERLPNMPVKCNLVGATTLLHFSLWHLPQLSHIDGVY
jgi:hypothetical protein